MECAGQSTATSLLERTTRWEVEVGKSWELTIIPPDLYGFAVQGDKGKV